LQSSLLNNYVALKFVDVAIINVKSLRSSNFYIAALVACCVIVVTGMLTVAGVLPLRVFKAFFYACLPTLPVLTLLYNILDVRGLIEKSRSRYERLLMITTLVLGVLAVATIGLVWYFVS